MELQGWLREPARTAILQVPPISSNGTVREISRAFGGAEQLRQAVHQLQNLLYAA